VCADACDWQGAGAADQTCSAARSGMYNYVVTAHKPSAVHLSLTANFTGAKDKNLIVTKSNRLVIYLLTPECLQPILDTSVYGRIANIEVIRCPGADKDSLCLLTERLKFCVLDYDSATGELLTKAMGDVTDAVGRMIDSGPIMHIDPASSSQKSFM
jgi:DNA damage-binding protein 1